MRILVALILIAAAVAVYWQFVDPTLFGLIEQSPAEQMGEAAGQAADAAGDAAEDAADAVEDAAN
jgi:hypothetical protein